MAYTQQDIEALREAVPEEFAADTEKSGACANTFNGHIGHMPEANVLPQGSEALTDAVNEHASENEAPERIDAAQSRRDQGNDARRTQNFDATIAAYAAGVARYNNFTIEIGGEEMDAEEFENEITDMLDNWEEHKQNLREQGYSDEEIAQMRDKLERAEDMLADGHLTEQEKEFLQSLDGEILNKILDRTNTNSADNDEDVDTDLVINNTNSLSQNKASDNSDTLSQDNLNQSNAEFSVNGTLNDADVNNNSSVSHSRLTAEEASPEQLKALENANIDDLQETHFPTAPSCTDAFTCAVNNKTIETQNARSLDKEAPNTTTGPTNSPGDLGLA